MASTKSGLTKEQRESFLREHGWEFYRASGGGSSHSTWYNPKLKSLAPDLLYGERHGQGTPAWLRNICTDPATGTWREIEKQVIWCTEYLLKNEKDNQRRLTEMSMKMAFNEVMKKYDSWKKETKHRLKAGLEPNRSPVDYHKDVQPLSQLRRDHLKGGL